jgi:6-phosphogluconolactonase
MSNDALFLANGVIGEIQSISLDASYVEAPSIQSTLEGYNGIGPLVVHPTGRTLYAATRKLPMRLLTFAIGSDRHLREVGSVSLSEDLLYLSIDASGRWLFGASYKSGNVCVCEIDPESLLARQPHQTSFVAANIHAVTPDTSNNAVLVPSLAEDRLYRLAFDDILGRLLPTSSICEAEKGAGPRHLAATQTGRFLFVLNELDATVDTYVRNEQGSFERTDRSASILPPGLLINKGSARQPGSAAAKGDVEVDAMWAADLRLSPDNAYVYATERTTSLITVFRLDADTGTLSRPRHYGTEQQPRSISISKSGTTLVAAGERSHYLSIYQVTQDGALELRQLLRTGFGVGWVEFSMY